MTHWYRLLGSGGALFLREPLRSHQISANRRRTPLSGRLTRHHRKATLRAEAARPMKGRIDESFRSHLGGFPLRNLEAHAGSVVGLWRDYRIAYVNPAWDRFAEENGGQPAVREKWDLGACIMDAIPQELQRFYHQLFERSVEKRLNRGTARPVGHEYECPSGSLRRRFHLDVFALGQGAGFMVIHSLVAEEPLDQVGHAPDRSIYEDQQGVIRQCVHCRRVRTVLDPQRWDWVPAWVESVKPNVSHSLCRICLGYYYPVFKDTPPE
jgi:hypothetical protein